MIATYRVFELLVTTRAAKDVPVQVTGSYSIAGFSGTIEDCDTAVTAYLASLFDDTDVEVTECHLVAEVGDEIPPVGTTAVNAAREALRAAITASDTARWEAEAANEALTTAEWVYARAVARVRGEED